MQRKVSLAVTLLFLGALALASHGCSHSGTVASGAVEDNFAPDLTDQKLKERLGDDDGYSMAVMFGSDTHGSLETCG